MTATAIKRPSEIRAIFEGACEARAPFVLATQYLNFNSTFVYLSGDEIHAKTAAGAEDALCILHVNDINLRFEHELGFMEASTKLLGLGSFDGIKTVKFSLPALVDVSGGRQFQPGGDPVNHPFRYSQDKDALQGGSVDFFPDLGGVLIIIKNGSFNSAHPCDFAFR